MRTTHLRCFLECGCSPTEHQLLPPGRFLCVRSRHGNRVHDPRHARACDAPTWADYWMAAGSAECTSFRFLIASVTVAKGGAASGSPSDGGWRYRDTRSGKSKEHTCRSRPRHSRTGAPRDLSALAGTQSLTFNELKDLLEITDEIQRARAAPGRGSSLHAQSFVDRVPRTKFQITPAGVRRSTSPRHMESLIRRFARAKLAYRRFMTHSASSYRKY